MSACGIWRYCCSHCYFTVCQQLELSKEPSLFVSRFSQESLPVVPSQDQECDWPIQTEAAPSPSTSSCSHSLRGAHVEGWTEMLHDSEMMLVLTWAWVWLIRSSPWLICIMQLHHPRSLHSYTLLCVGTTSPCWIESSLSDDYLTESNSLSPNVCQLPVESKFFQICMCICKY